MIEIEQAPAQVGTGAAWRRLGKRLLPHAIALLILALLLKPMDPHGIQLPPYGDKLIHAGLFLVWVGLWRALRNPARPWRVAGAVVLIAVGSELVQHWWIEGRQGDLQDLGADLIGAGIGWWLGVLLQKATISVSKTHHD